MTDRHPAELSAHVLRAIADRSDTTHIPSPTQRRGIGLIWVITLFAFRAHPCLENLRTPIHQWNRQHGASLVRRAARPFAVTDVDGPISFVLRHMRIRTEVLYLES